MTLHPVAIHDVIIDTLKLLDKFLFENIHFDLNLSKEKLIVLADSGQVSQVLINLAMNARDSMPAGGEIKIETCLVSLDEEEVLTHGLEFPGKYTVISVSDTGSGIEENTLQRIYEPFFTTKVVGKGTGLGLFIVYGIIKQHKGSILVESKPGEGTVFRIYLPLITAEIVQVQREEKILPKESGGTILVVEDEEVVRQFLKTTLAREGYQLIFAADGAEALRKYKKYQGHTISGYLGYCHAEDERAGIV